jgi:hypothetical protein
MQQKQRGSYTSLALLLLLSSTCAFRCMPYYVRFETRQFMGKKKAPQRKLSYAERLQLHREKVAREKGLIEPPLTAASREDENAPKQLAKKLVDAQRKSVDMLTFVKERVAALPFGPVLEALEKDGYVVVDEFFGKDDVVSRLEAEGVHLFEKGLMETDLTRIGSGEYIAAIKGGEEQYQVCPRTIEMVVSITKHLPSYLAGYKLDESNCIATLRTYDRSSRQASLSLIDGGDLPPMPFDIVANETNDARKITLLYYPIAGEWQSGGIVVQKDNESVLSAKRDRLIIFLSDSCRHRHEYFEGNDKVERASCLELHLIARADGMAGAPGET